MTLKDTCKQTSLGTCKIMNVTMIPTTNESSLSTLDELLVYSNLTMILIVLIAYLLLFIDFRVQHLSLKEMSTKFVIIVCSNISNLKLANKLKLKLKSSQVNFAKVIIILHKQQITQLTENTSALNSSCHLTKTSLPNSKCSCAKLKCDKHDCNDDDYKYANDDDKEDDDDDDEVTLKALEFENGAQEKSQVMQSISFAVTTNKTITNRLEFRDSIGSNLHECLEATIKENKDKTFGKAHLLRPDWLSKSSSLSTNEQGNPLKSFNNADEIVECKHEDNNNRKMSYDYSVDLTSSAEQLELKFAEIIRLTSDNKISDYRGRNASIFHALIILTPQMNSSDDYEYDEGIRQTEFGISNNNKHLSFGLKVASAIKYNLAPILDTILNCTALLTAANG